MRTRLLATVRRHPLLAFYAVACAWSWRGWLVALATGGRSEGIDPFGPLVAALVVTLAAEGLAGAGRLLRRLVAWRAGARWWLFALGLPVAISLAAAAANVALGAARPTPAQLARWPELFLAFPVILVVAGPLGEELGWRGFVLPRLREGRSELAAALLVGALWAGWHLPLLVGNLRAEWAPMIVSVLAASVLLARLDRGSGGSVLLPMVMHASQNTVGGEYVRPMFSGADAVREAWLLAEAYAAAAAAVAIAGWRRAPREAARARTGSDRPEPVIRSG